MKNLIIFDHPYAAEAWRNIPHQRSFCAALCKNITDKLEARGDEVDLLDLHADDFDPVMRAEDLANWRRGNPINGQIADYQARVKSADRLIFIFPIWWDSMPAMTKGFIDKVYAKDLLYTQPSEYRLVTTLNHDTEIVLVTPLGMPLPIYKYIMRAPAVRIFKQSIFRKTGIKNFRWLPYARVDKMTAEQRAQLLANVPF